MLIRLGNLALDADARRPRLSDEMLTDAAWQTYRAAAAGTALELRGALVLVCLASVELAPTALTLAGAVGYEVGPLGGHLYGLVKRMGGDPSAALEALRALYPPSGERPTREAAGGAGAQRETPDQGAAAPGPTPPAAPPPATPAKNRVTDEDKQRFGVVRAPPRDVPAQAPAQASPTGE
jgi:hypothetical protein